MAKTITLKIILQSPPAGVDYGIQKGSGNTYETVLTQRSNGNDLAFNFIISIKLKDDSVYSLQGPFVQGPSAARFIYIDIGTYAGQKDSIWSRRLKIPLSGITNELFKKLLADSDFILQTLVAGTGKDGGPNCATVKPFNGWKLAKARPMPPSFDTLNP